MPFQTKKTRKLIASGQLYAPGERIKFRNNDDRCEVCGTFIKSDSSYSLCKSSKCHREYFKQVQG
jgi:hypothetical protein